MKRYVALGSSMIVVTVGGVSDSTLVTVAPPGGPANIAANSATTLTAQVNQLVTAPSVLVTDAFMEALAADGEWALRFNGEVHRSVPARGLWRRCLWG